MSSHRERNDRRGAFRGAPHGGGRRGNAVDAASWIWGVHAVEACLANPSREAAIEVLSTPERVELLPNRGAGLTLRVCEAGEIARHLPPGAAHQGLALRTPPLDGVDLESLGQPASGVLVMLDQVTDPQNVGAIFRSATALGARGVILQDRHAPPLGGALAKASAGAIDRLPAARVVNLARALDRLSDWGWTIVGLAGHGETPLGEAFDGGPCVLVLGSEGEGMRRLVSEHCDRIARIPMPGQFDSLNVGAAAAIALYQASVAAAGTRLR